MSIAPFVTAFFYASLEFMRHLRLAYDLKLNREIPEEVKKALEEGNFRNWAAENTDSDYIMDIDDLMEEFPKEWSKLVDIIRYASGFDGTIDSIAELPEEIKISEEMNDETIYFVDFMRELSYFRAAYSCVEEMAEEIRSRITIKIGVKLPYFTMEDWIRHCCYASGTISI